MATWKKVIVSGSQAHLAAVTASAAIGFVGTASWAQSSSQATTASYVTGSVHNSSNPALSASYALTASYIANVTLANNLTQGTGITVFTYNGSSAQTVAVSGASTLNSNKLSKWTGAAFADSNISDDGSSQIQIGTSAYTVTIPGNTIIQGTASFQNTQNLLIADKFALFNSGSTTTGPGGIVVQQATQNIGEAFAWDSTSNRWAITSSFSANQSTFTPNAYMAVVYSSSATSPNTTSPPTNYNAVGNIFVSSDEGIWIYS